MRNRFCSSLSTSEMAMMQGRLQLILGLMAQLDQQATHLQSEEKIKMIQYTVHYMEQHYDEDLTVEQLANMAGMVRWQYSQQFKTLTGQKPTDYLVHLRIKQAKKLLCNSTEPLSKLSRQIGFKDEYYFSRCFRKLTGILRVNMPISIYILSKEQLSIHLAEKFMFLKCNAYCDGWQIYTWRITRFRHLPYRSGHLYER